MKKIINEYILVEKALGKKAICKSRMSSTDNINMNLCEI
jgi:hypothetical protein